MGTHLIDTNVIIGFLGGSLPGKAVDFIEELIEKKIQHISVINQIELLSFNAADDEMKVLEDFVKISNVISLSESVTQQTILLRRKHKIKLPDAVIAATCLAQKLTLITRNTKDFKNISGLKMINPFDL